METGKLYNSNDMVRVGCEDCKGCHSCCQGMGDSIQLNPYDLYRLQMGTGMHAEALLAQGYIELQVQDGLILPNLKMMEGKEQCAFLNDAGRCSIHSYRPELCRLYPLGRNYDDKGFQYFVLEDACPYPEKTKVKIKKWLDIPRLAKHEQFIQSWHDFLKESKGLVQTMEEAQIKAYDMKLLQHFYLTPFADGEDFYESFGKRLEQFSKL